ncbi:MAG TPA: glycosyltransferase [Trebonia sp.]|jgi:glycosyltransferase involved in cell wall biosynthesis|nr:glycosyltransferase [Trebonia sp.]
MPPVAVVIPARGESERVGATVTSAATLPGVDVVVVVDDGSRDATAQVAQQAGATEVVRHARSRGKAAAMETGAERVRLLDERDGVTRLLLFLDADLGDTAALAGPLITPVAVGDADMTIAVFTSTVKLGGHGFVVGLSARGIRRATGWTPTQPLNGQRSLSRAAYEAVRPLAFGYGAETAMTIEAKRRGLRIAEVEVPLAHRATGKDARSQLHRVRQFVDVAWALAWRL